MKILATLWFGCLLWLSTGLTRPAAAQSAVPPTLNATLDGYDYPYPVKHLPLRLEGQPVRMAYMDVPAAGKANGTTVLLLHGKNFFGAYWRGTVEALTKAGFRVVVPDQIGFGKSDKPNIHYSFHQLAENTKTLLDSLKVKKAVVVGHSMGGMVATRFAIEYPAATQRLVLENPIGLEDYRRGVPYQDPLEATTAELRATEESIRQYHASYYPGPYPQAHDQWLLPLLAQKRHPDYPNVAVASALTYQMIYQQPVSYEFDRVLAPTLLIIGQQDRTVVGKGLIKDAKVLEKMGNYPALGQRTAKAIKDCKLVELPGVGHIPHLQEPQKFYAALLAFLK
jgi:pimeloyl-ACP methyl ester carboxylesterase